MEVKEKNPWETAVYVDAERLMTERCSWLAKAMVIRWTRSLRLPRRLPRDVRQDFSSSSSLLRPALEDFLAVDDVLRPATDERMRRGKFRRLSVKLCSSLRSASGGERAKGGLRERY